MKKIIAILVLSLLTSAHAKIKVKDVKYLATNEQAGQVTISYEGQLLETPELTVKDSIIQVAIPNSVVWPKIEKKVTTVGEEFDTTLMAYQYDKKLVRFRAILPFSLNGYEKDVNVVLNDGNIALNFPRVKTQKTVKAVPAPKKSILDYDESYLDKLLKDKQTKGGELEVKKIEKKPVEKQHEDKITSTFSSGQKDGSKGSFSLTSYIGKFAAFLGLVLLLFYGVVTLFKKGVLKKGKLGFLNNTQVVSVLNTTYVGPKKSLMMVKVHKQIFLLASDDKGIHFLSEVSDTTGLLKEGETAVTGNNFDTSLASAEQASKDFKLKETETPLSNFLTGTDVQERVKLSEQIKSKVKNLKQLQ